MTEKVILSSRCGSSSSRTRHSGCYASYINQKLKESQEKRKKGFLSGLFSSTSKVNKPQSSSNISRSRTESARISKRDRTLSHSHNIPKTVPRIDKKVPREPRHVDELSHSVPQVELRKAKRDEKSGLHDKYFSSADSIGSNETRSYNDRRSRTSSTIIRPERHDSNNGIRRSSVSSSKARNSKRSSTKGKDKKRGSDARKSINEKIHAHQRLSIHEPSQSEKTIKQGNKKNVEKKRKSERGKSSSKTLKHFEQPC